MRRGHPIRGCMVKARYCWAMVRMRMEAALAWLRVHGFATGLVAMGVTVLLVGLFMPYVGPLAKVSLEATAINVAVEAKGEYVGCLVGDLRPALGDPHALPRTLVVENATLVLEGSTRDDLAAVFARESGVAASDPGLSICPVYIERWGAAWEDLKWNLEPKCINVNEPEPAELRIDEPASMVLWSASSWEAEHFDYPWDEITIAGVLPRGGEWLEGRSLATGSSAICSSDLGHGIPGRWNAVDTSAPTTREGRGRETGGGSGVARRCVGGARRPRSLAHEWTPHDRLRHSGAAGSPGGSDLLESLNDG
jgi:hypothetical protein